MGIAVISVTLLIWLTLGRRESWIVALAIPVTLAFTLTVFYLLGYTLNRITLFALIFSIGNFRVQVEPLSQQSQLISGNLSLADSVEEVIQECGR